MIQIHNKEMTDTNTNKKPFKQRQNERRQIENSENRIVQRMRMAKMCRVKLDLSVVGVAVSTLLHNTTAYN